MHPMALMWVMRVMCHGVVLTVSTDTFSLAWNLLVSKKMIIFVQE